MQVKLIFGQTEESFFLVMTEVLDDRLQSASKSHSVTTYPSEDAFLELVMAADLAVEKVAIVASTVLLSVARPRAKLRSVAVDLSRNQIQTLHLQVNDPDEEAAEEECSGGKSDPSALLSESGLYALMMQAPTPLAILEGPEHRFNFVNPAYLEMLQRNSMAGVVGDSVREVFPELEGHGFFEILDQVYRTGKPYIGSEYRGKMRNAVSGNYFDVYFDFVYQPIRSENGRVRGIMVQASDVTDHVLARDVSDHREGQLYRQWVELEGIYKTAPIGLALFDAKSLQILRMNDRQAEMMGFTAEEVCGKAVPTLFPSVPELADLLRRAAEGESIHNHVLTGYLPSEPGDERFWLVNYSPSLSPSGDVEAIIAVSLEITLQIQAKAILAKNKILAE